MPKRLVGYGVRGHSRSSTNPDEIGSVHLEGLDQHDHRSFCGFCWDGAWEDTDDPVNCEGCLRAVKQADQIITKAREAGQIPAGKSRKRGRT